MATNSDKKLVTTVADLRHSAEEQLQVAAAELLLPRTFEETQRLVHELQVHQVELQMQNEALRQTRGEVEVLLDRYTDLFDFAPVGYFILDRKGSVVSANLTATGLLGIERAGLIGRDFRLFVADEYRRSFAEFFEGLFVDHNRKNCELTLTIRGDFRLSVRIEGIICGTQQECRLAVIDITELKLAEVTLRESEKRLALAVSATRIGIFDWNLATHTILWTQAHDAIFGYSTTTTTTTTATITTATTEHDYHRWADRVHPEDLPLVEEESRRCMQEHTLFEMPYRIIWPDGSLHWIECKGVFLNDSDGNASRMLGVVRDITEHRRVDEVLQESEALYRGIGESIDYGVWVCAADGRNTYASESFLKMAGITQEQCSNFGWASLLHPDDVEHTIAAWQECVRTGGMWDREHRIRGVDGQWHHVLARGVPIKNRHGEIVRWAGINLDISARKLVEDKLQKSEQQRQRDLQSAHDELELRVAERTVELADSINHLQSEIRERELAEISLREEVNQRLRVVDALREKEQMLILQSRLAAMGEMINNIAHQWRQPLNTLGLVIQKLPFLYDSNEFSRELLEKNSIKAMELIQHMSKTINDFMNFFRSDKEIEVFYINQVLRQTLSLVEQAFQNARIGIDVHIDGDPTACGYTNEYAQVLLNILMNARDALIEHAIDNARITLHAFVEGETTVVTITDNAGGIPHENIDRLFDPYFTTKGPDKGTGLGLFMSKMIIEKNMNGRLSVRNTRNGAEFRLEVAHGKC